MHTRITDISLENRDASASERDKKSASEQEREAGLLFWLSLLPVI